MRKLRLLVLAALLAAPATSFAHYPFPASEAEKAKADAIQQAVEAATQASVASLTALLDDENPRVQAAALLGILRLSRQPLDFAAPAAAAAKLEDSEHALVAAAAEVARILLDKDLGLREQRARLVELTRSQAGRHRPAAMRRGQCKEGFERRMAIEGLKVVGDASVLPALEALADDGFGDHDDTFDMKANARVAFEAWWAIRSAGLDGREKLRTLVATLELGQPFRSRWCDAACERLEAAGDAAVPMLIPIARGGGRAKLWALRTLRHFRANRDAIDTVLEVCSRDLDSEDPLVRHAAAYALSVLAEKKVLPILAEALATSPDPYVRERAASGLGRIDDQAAVPRLKAALNDPHPAVRTRAAAQLARKGFADGEDILLDALGAPEGSAGHIAVGAMAFINDRDRLVARIAELLHEQPGEKDLGRRQRLLLQEMRHRMLRQLATWDPDTLRPLAPTLRPALRQGPRSAWKQAVLKKLGD
ncbi:MAG: HEAT repeat domain-containing protein [Candidatus Brocadiia bacterium]